MSKKKTTLLVGAITLWLIAMIWFMVGDRAVFGSYASCALVLFWMSLAEPV